VDLSASPSCARRMGCQVGSARPTTGTYDRHCWERLVKVRRLVSLNATMWLQAAGMLVVLLLATLVRWDRRASASDEGRESPTALSCARPCEAYRAETMTQADQRALFEGVDVVDETPRHALLCVIGGKRVWVTPGSRRRGTEGQKRGDRGTLVVSKAFAIRNGLWENASSLPAMNLRRSLSPVSLSPTRPAPAPPERVLDSGHRFGQRR